MRFNLTPEMVEAFKQRQMRIALLIELEFALSTARFWTRRGTLSWQGVNWNGIVGTSSSRGSGSVITSISKMTETNEVKSTSVTFGLSGVPIENDGQNVLRLLTDYTQQGLNARIWISLFNLTTYALIADPAQFFQGQLDVPIIEPSADTFQLSITAVSKLDILQRRPGLRYNLESHQKLHPGDLGFEFTNRSAHQTDNFG